MQMTLKRNSSNNYGTKGGFLIDGAHECFVLEPATLVLPAGDYVLNRYFSNKNQFIVLRYESPTDPTFADRCIEIHPGNVVQETEGCSLPGTEYGQLDFRNDPKYPDRWSWGVVDGILNSHVAFEALMSKVPDGTPITVLPLAPSVALQEA